MFVFEFHLCSVCEILYVDLFPLAAEAILLGFQHYLVMLGTTVLIPSSLVPQMGGGNVCFHKDSNSQFGFFMLFFSFMWMLSLIIYMLHP